MKIHVYDLYNLIVSEHLFKKIHLFSQVVVIKEKSSYVKFYSQNWLIHWI